MHHVDVPSTTIASVGYDPDSLILEIKFTTGKLYQYFDVPPAIHSGLMNSDSKGKFFNAHIRTKFRFTAI